MRSQLVRRALRAAASAASPPARAPRVFAPRSILHQRTQLIARPLQISSARHFSQTPNDNEGGETETESDSETIADAEAPQYLGVVYDASR